jgi:hypothetical protein
MPRSGGNVVPYSSPTLSAQAVSLTGRTDQYLHQAKATEHDKGVGGNADCKTGPIRKRRMSCQAGFDTDIKNRATARLLIE